MKYGEIRGNAQDFEGFATPPAAPASARRITIEPEKVEQGLVQLVLSLLELVRQLMEKQALRRIEGGGLSTAQVEELGVTLMRLDQQMKDLQVQFNIKDLNIDLGPLGPLIDERE